MPTKPINIENLVTNLSGYFRQRRETSYAWSDVISAYMGLLGLRGLWPTSVIGDSGALVDISAQGRHLTNNNDVPVAQYNAAYWASTSAAATSKYFNRSDEAGLSIIGTEAYIDQANRGLSFGCWLNVRVTPSSQAVVMGKWDASTNNRSYSLQMTTGRQAVFMISNDGSSAYQIQAPHTFSTDRWRWKFVCCVYDAYPISKTISIYVHTSTGLKKYTNSTSIPASIFDSSADFTIGAGHGMSLPMTAMAISLPFLCASSLSEGTVRALYGISRPLFLTFPNV